jgi:pimeloyl-ACP methyl ester carboxylesterase
MYTHTLTIAGNQVTFDRIGAGSPVLLLHGAFQTRYLWRNVAYALSKTHTVIAPDLRGIGDTGVANGDFSFKLVAQELAELMQALKFERYAVVGHDLGAGVAYALAAQHRDRVTRFAFLDMLLPGFGFENAWIPQPNGQFLWFAALNSVPGIVESLLKGREREYLEHVLRGAFTANKAAITDEDLRIYSAAYAKPGVMASLGGYFRAMWKNAEDIKSMSIPKIEMPVLAMGGEFSVADGAAQSMRAVATDVSSRIIAASGHWLPEENMLATVDALGAFVRE